MYLCLLITGFPLFESVDVPRVLKLMAIKQEWDNPPKCMHNYVFEKIDKVILKEFQIIS